MKRPLITAKGSLIAFTLCTFFASNTYAFEELGSIDLGPAEAPALPVAGTKKFFIQDDEEQMVTVTEVTDTHIAYLSADGCSWESPLHDFDFTATGNWNNCSGSSGTKKIKAKGSMFPLQSGSKASYSIKGEVTKGAWTGKWNNKRKCKVSGAVRIKTATGEHDTWKVVCKPNDDKRTMYYSPELGTRVVHIRKHYKNSTRSFHSELLRVE
ncbi:MAG: hypothetical protein ACI9J2_002446 [Saprospiraceae bacterium]|jgi:hypothetical protein